MIQYFKNLLLSDTGKDTGIVLAGTLINVIIGGLFFILGPRILGPAYSYFFTINLYFITALVVFVTIISVAVGKLWLPFEFKAIEKSQAIEFYKYNFWIAGALVISSIPFDNYFLIRIAGPVQAGLYSAPFKLLTFAYQFGGNFTRVLASRFASFDSDKKAREFT